MRQVYIETSAIQKATALFPSGDSFERALADAGFELALGFHVLYELIRACTVGNDETVQCLTVLADMDRIRYLPQPGDLIQNEVYQLLHGGKVLKTIPQWMAGLIRTEIYFVSRGHVRKAKEFIADRQERFEVGQPKINRAARAMIRDVVRRNPALGPQLRRWEGFRAATCEWWPQLVRTATGRLPKGLVETAFARPIEFPALNTYLNVQLHLQFLAWTEQQPPGTSRVDDYRNVIESTASDLFVTHDGKLLKRFSTINPFTDVLSWGEFRSKLVNGTS